MKIPSDLRYTKEHEWVSVDEGVVTVGITDYAQGELGDIVFIELPEVGDEVEELDSFGTIEAVKTVSELFSPVTGTVEEINGALEDKPELINEDPYGDGWMIKIRIEEMNEDELLSPKDYKDMLA